MIVGVVKVCIVLCEPQRFGLHSFAIIIVRLAVLIDNFNPFAFAPFDGNRAVVVNRENDILSVVLRIVTHCGGIYADNIAVAVVGDKIVAVALVVNKNICALFPLPPIMKSPPLLPVIFMSCLIALASIV